MLQNSISLSGRLVISCLLLAFASLALADPTPNPQRVHIIGPIPFSVDEVQCAGLGENPVLVETAIEELWGIQLGIFNQGFPDGSGGWHLVQPSRWTMSAVSLGEEFSWWGRASGRAIGSNPGQTGGGTFSFQVNSILRADGDWPDLRLQLTSRFVVDANGNLRLFDDRLEISCFN